MKLNQKSDINTTRLRLLLGWLAMALPWLVVLILKGFPSSISATFYEPYTVATFMVILGASSFLLISYKGYELIDDIVNTVAGVFGIMICLFPCYDEFYHEYEIPVSPFHIPVNVSSVIHNTSAIIFFSMLAINSLFLFTRSGGVMSASKKKRNIIYRICGVGMVGAFLMFLLPNFFIKTWLIEAIALAFFGISFLTKANIYPWLFAEPKEETNDLHL